MFLILATSLYGQKDTVTVIIMHTNDMHSKIDNFPKIAFLIDSIRKTNKDVYLFSAGDLVTGNPIVDRYKIPGYPMIDLMNRVGYQITEIGNHEFDLWQSGLNRAMKQAKFPFICANIDASKAELNQPKAYYKFVTPEGISIGVLGLLELEKNGMPASNPVHLKGIKFLDPFKTAKKYASYKDSSDVFICLSHLGIETDRVLAKKFPNEFDVIIGGHSHTVIPKGEMLDGTLITQAGSYLRYLGVLTLKFYNGKLVSKSDKLISVRKTKNYDKNIAKIVDAYDNNPIFDKVVGTAKAALIGENELGAMMTDAMIDTLHCDIAFQNTGGIRIHSIPAGKITKKQIFELAPFGNVYIVYNLTLKQIKKLIAYAYNLHKSNQIQPSGVDIEIFIDKDKNLKEIKLFKNGKELPKGHYSVAINDYMATAYVLPFLQNGGKKYDIVDAGAIIGFLKKKSPIDYKGVKRVKIIVE
jgi:5'-nucleotidase